MLSERKTARKNNSFAEFNSSLELTQLKRDIPSSVLIMRGFHAC